MLVQLARTLTEWHCNSFTHLIDETELRETFSAQAAYLHLLHGSAGSFFDPTWPLNALTSETRRQLLHDDAHVVHIFLQQCCGATPPGCMLSFNARRQAPSMPNERSGTHVTQDLGARHVNEGMFTTVVILNENSFRSRSEARSLLPYVCRLWWSSLQWWVVRRTQRL